MPVPPTMDQVFDMNTKEKLMAEKLQVQKNSKINPTNLSERKLAPDLARGFMLLFISVANVPLFLYNTKPQLADHIMRFIVKVWLNEPSRHLFIFMFMYGLVQLMRRLEYENKLDWIRIRKLLERRGVSMILIGLLHVIFLAPIDVIAIYGMIGIILVDFLRFKDKILSWSCIISFAFLLYLFAIHTENPSTDVISSSFIQQNPFLISLKFKNWMGSIIPTILLSLPIVFLGILAARYKILDEPSKYRRFLKWTAVIGLSSSILSGIPLALINLGFSLDAPKNLVIFVSKLYLPLSLTSALGYVAFFGLIAIKLENKRNSITNAIVALGQRSMTFYLFQSFVFIIIFSPYVGGLGASMGQASSTVIAIVTWMLSVFLADWMHRYRYRGPAEVFLRKITYYK